MKRAIWFESKKIWSQRKTVLFLGAGLILIVGLLLFNFLKSEQEDPLMNQGSFTMEQEDYLLGINAGIDAQEEVFLTAAGKGKSLEGILTLPTYPFYRKMLNTKLIEEKQPIQSMRYGTRSSIFPAILLSYLAGFSGIVYFLFLFGDLLTREIEEQNLFLTLVQPVSRRRIFFSKYFLSFLLSLGCTILFLLVGFLLSQLVFGGSSFHYPVIVFTEKSMEMIPIWQYLLQLFVLFSFILGFCLALHYGVSLVFKKTGFSLIVTVILLFECYFLSTMKVDFVEKIAHWNPFTYLNAANIFVGFDFMPIETMGVEHQLYYANWCLPRTLHNSQINLQNGLLVLGIATIILLFLGYKGFQKNLQTWSF